MANQQEFIRSSRVFLAELDRLQDLEREKGNLSPGDGRRVALAHEVEDVTVGLLSLGRYQTRLVELEAQAHGIQEPAPRAPGAILEEWRVAERELHDARSALERATDKADGLRLEHSRSMDRTKGESG
jgi:hypothetical protein